MGRTGRVGGGVARGARGRRRLHELRGREVLRQPATALRERLRVGVDALDRGEPIGHGEQAVRDLEHQLTADEESALEQGVDGVGDGALRRVLDRHHAVEDGRAADRVEDALDGGRLGVARREPEERTRGDVRVRALGPEEGDGDGCLDGQARAHHLAVHGDDRLAREATGALLREPVEERALALGIVGGDRCRPLGAGDVRDDVGPLLEQRQDLIVDGVDPVAKILEAHGA
jgi:hypothetical protein